VPESPYARLLHHAGVAPSDLRALVQREGVEGALTQLAASGVHLSLDEFKGRTAIRRGSLEVAVTARVRQSARRRPYPGSDWRLAEHRHSGPGGGYDIYSRPIEPHPEAVLGVELAVINVEGAGGIEAPNGSARWPATV